MKFSTCAIGAALLSLAAPSAVYGFAPAALSSTASHTRATTTSLLEMSTASRSSDADLTAFADSLEEEKKSTSSRRRRTTTTKNNSSSSNKSLDSQTWQASVDELLDPSTPLSRRQALVAKLVNSNKDIQQSVVTALRDRKVNRKGTSQKASLYAYSRRMLYWLRCASYGSNTLF